MSKLIEFYTHLLEDLDITPCDEGFLTADFGGTKIPVTVSKKRLCLPTTDILRGGNWDKTGRPRRAVVPLFCPSCFLVRRCAETAAEAVDADTSCFLVPPCPKLCATKDARGLSSSCLTLNF